MKATIYFQLLIGPEIEDTAPFFLLYFHSQSSERYTINHRDYYGSHNLWNVGQNFAEAANMFGNKNWKFGEVLPRFLYKTSNLGLLG